jgi:hypothetical protein
MAIWLVLAGPAYVLKLTLQSQGALGFWKLVASWAARLGPIGGALDTFFARARGALEAGDDSQYVRVAVDESHRRLASAVAASEGAVQRAVADVRGLSGVSGPDTLLEKIHELQEKTKLIDAIGVDVEGDLDEKYAARAKAKTAIVFIAIFAIVFMLANGALLNLFFKGVIAVKIVGVPASLLLSIMMVAAEMALGFLLALLSRRPGAAPARWLLLLMIALAALFEAVVLGMVSNGFDLDIPLLDDHPLLKLWMAPLGLVLVTATSITGFMFHQTLDELAEHSSANRLRSELAQANAFVRDLPAAWQGITQKAHEAEEAITGYLSAVGGHGGQITGSIDKISSATAELLKALRGAKVENWPALVAVSKGDQRRAALQNIGMFLFTLAGLAAFAEGLSFLVAGAIGSHLPRAADLALAIVPALGFYSIGLLAIQRLQLVEGSSDGRPLPIRSGALEYAIAGVIVAACATGVIWASVAALGTWGVLLGIILVGCGGLLALAGYGFERAVRGGALVLTVLIAFAFGAAAAVLALARYVLLWVLAALSWAVTAALTLLAAPIDMILKAVRARSRPGPGTDAVQKIAA